MSLLTWFDLPVPCVTDIGYNIDEPKMFTVIGKVLVLITLVISKLYMSYAHWDM